MGARQKLNTVYLSVAAVCAGFAALLFKSATVFVICLGGMIAAMLHDGTVRPKATRRH